MVLYNNINLLDSKWSFLVKTICDKIEKEKDKFLNKIIIFGSTSRNECNKNSDLDVYLEYDCDVMDSDYIIDQNIIKSSDYFLFGTNGNCDICYSGLVSKKLKKNIDNDGIVVYIRKDNNG